MQDSKPSRQDSTAAEDPLSSAIVLATTRGPDGGSELLFGFGSPAPELREVINTSELFCVLADSRPLGSRTDSVDPDRPTFGNRFWAGDWQMAAAIGPPRYGDGVANVVILKFADKTLDERLASPETWMNPALFSAPAGEEGIAALAAALRAELSAEAAAEAELGNTDLTKISDDRSWHGLLLLRPVIGARGLPAALAFLAADPEMATLEARYGALASARPGDSPSASGAVRYAAGSEAAADDGSGVPDTPALRVLTLEATFENGAVSSFTARIALSVPGPEPIVLESRSSWRESRKGYGFAPPEGTGRHMLAADGDAPRNLASWLTPALAPLWGIGGRDAPGMPLTLEMEVSWQGEDLAPGIPAMPLPVLPLAPIALTSCAAADIADQVGAAIAPWMQADLPARQSGNLIFAMKLVDSAGSRLRLDLPDVVLPTARVLLS
jgi:hypothetical protein